MIARSTSISHRRILSRGSGETIRRAPGGRGQRCRDAAALLRRACRGAAAAADITEPGQPLPQLLAQAVGGQAGAVVAQVEAQTSEEDLHVGKSEKSIVIVAIAGGEGADRGWMRLGALGGVGIA